VRRAAHARGLRFRLHRKDLPGKPDLVFAKWRIVLFVHGCFWHRHTGCKRASIPNSRVAFWEKKLDRNVARDAEVAAQLIRLGWKVDIIWECEVRKPDRLTTRLDEVFGVGRQHCIAGAL
jgi:DNA mismatch endonuclease, patch repair protein